MQGVGGGGGWQTMQRKQDRYIKIRVKKRQTSYSEYNSVQ